MPFSFIVAYVHVESFEEFEVPKLLTRIFYSSDGPPCIEMDSCNQTHLDRVVLNGSKASVSCEPGLWLKFPGLTPTRSQTTNYH